MSLLTDSKLKLICPDAWVARAYSEYLADCAASQANMIAEISNAIADSTLSTLIDTRSDLLTTTVGNITSEVVNILVQQGVVDENELQSSSTTFKTVLQQQVQDPSSYIRSQAVALMSEWPDVYHYDTFADDFTAETDDVLITDVQILTAVNVLTSTTIQNLGVSGDSDYSLNEGFISFNTLIKTTILNSVLSPSNPEISLTLHNASGSSISTSMDVDNILEEMKSSLASTTAWAQGFAALTKETVTDAISFFDAQIHTVISNVNEAFASTVAQVRSVLASTDARVKDFFASASEMLGWNQVHDDLFTTINDTDVTAYTGASPLAAVNLKSAVGIATAVGNTLLGVGAAIWQGVCSLGEKLWNKAKPFVKALTADPVDIVVQDQKDESYAISNFKFTTSNTATFNLDFLDASASNKEVIETRLYDIINNMLDQWYGMETYFCEVCFRITSCAIYEDAIHLGYDLMYRTKIINPSVAKDYGLLYQFSTGPTLWISTQIHSSDGYKGLSDWIGCGDMYLPDDADETKFLAGLIYSAMLSYSAHLMAYSDIAPQSKTVNGFSISDIFVTDGYIDYSGAYQDYHVIAGSTSRNMVKGWGGNTFIPSSATNLDFIKGSCGAYDLSNDPSLHNYVYQYLPLSDVNHSSNTVYWSIDVCVVPLIALLIMQQYDRYMRPTDYLFLPYCKGTYNFSNGRYRIKTDAENANIANVLATAIFIIVAIAAVVLIGKGIMKILKNRKQSRLRTWLGQQDQAMWSKGKKLNILETAKYNRYQNKLDKITKAGSGLAGSPSTGSSLLGGLLSIGKKLGGSIDISSSIAHGAVVTKQQQDQTQSFSGLNSRINGVSQDVSGLNTRIVNETSKVYKAITGNTPPLNR